jgi:hypothetical protein
MSSAQKNLLRLAASLAEHENVTHWAISMRLFGKGDFFRRLENGSHPRTDTYERALENFSKAWPEDLTWPSDIPRPSKSKSQEAA